MADNNTDAASKMAIVIPIAQVSPDTSPSSSVHGVVTIVWPFNKVKTEVAFILAEPEVRLRRSKGQIRVNFQGSSARAISDCGLGSSDKIQLSLEGAEWLPNDKAKIPGIESDWQLKFSERLSLHVKLGESAQVTQIDVDHPPQPEAAPAAIAAPAQDIQADLPPLDLPALPELPSATPVKSAAFARLNDGEYESPAFVKRARISYGSLFEDDIFEEDGGVKGRGRKRTRFSLNPGSWRYSSKSPSPELPVADEVDASSEEKENEQEKERSSPPPRPSMTDEGCQTMEFELAEPPLHHTPVKHNHHVSQVDGQPSAFLNTGGFVDQGHQIFPAQNWDPPSLPDLQPPYSNPELFGGSEAVASFGSHTNGVTGTNRERGGWDTQILPDQTDVYPDLPIESSEDVFDSHNQRTFGSHTDVGFSSIPVPTHDAFVQPGFGVSSAGSYRSADVFGNARASPPGHLQESSVYPDLEKDENDRPVPQEQISTVFSSSKSGVPLAQETVTIPANPFSRETSMPSERAAITAGNSSWAAVNNRALSRSASRPTSSRLGSGDGQTPQSAMVIDESDSDQEEEQVFAKDDADIHTDGHASSLADLAGRESIPTPITAGQLPGQDVAEEGWEEEVRTYPDHSPDRYDDEYDEDEDGGDYDTSNYLAPQDDEDDGDDMDLRQHRLEPEFLDEEAESWDDEEVAEVEGDEDEEEFDEESDQSDDDDSQRPQGQTARPVSNSPVFIDLLSDSDDDDKSPEPPPPNTMPVGRSLPVASQRMAKSPEYGPDSEVESDEDDLVETEQGLDSEQGLEVSDAEDRQSEGIGAYSDEDEIEIEVENDAMDQDGGASDSDVEQEGNFGREESEKQPTAVDRQRTQTPSSPVKGIQKELTRSPSPAPQPSTTDAVKVKKDEDKSVIQTTAFTERQPKGELQTNFTPAQSSHSMDVGRKNVEAADQDTAVPEKEGPIAEEELNPSKKATQELVEAEPDNKTNVASLPAPTDHPQTQDLPDREDADMGEPIAMVDAVVSDKHLPTPSPTQPLEYQLPEADTMDVDTVSQPSIPNPPVQEILAGVPAPQSMDAVSSPAVENTAEDTTVDLADEVTAKSLGAEPAASIQKDDVEPVQLSSFAVPSQGLSFESQVGGHDAMRAGLDAESQADTQMADTPAEYISDDISETNSFAFQLDADDELQASLREEDSRYFEMQEQASFVEEGAASEFGGGEQQEPETPNSSQVDKNEQQQLDPPDSRVSSPRHVEKQILTIPLPVAKHTKAKSPPHTHTKKVEGSPTSSPVRAGASHKMEALHPPSADIAEHVNEAGIAMGSPEWTAKERHEHEEPGVRDTLLGARATPVTHKNEAGVTVGSPERAAIERHQHEREEPTGKSPPPPVKSTPARSKADSEIAMGSPEKTAKRRSQINAERNTEEPMSDPSIKLARAAIASKNGLRSGGVTPDSSRPQTRSKSFQTSPTPDVVDDSIQLAKAALHTPSKTGRADAQGSASSPASTKVEDEAGSLAASKLKLLRHLRDALPDCTTLKVLRQYTGKSVEVMAVVMMTPPEPQRAKGGPREYMMSFTVTDHSVGPNGVVEVQLYRPHKESLPQVQTGDVVLLRSFTVVSLKGKGYGLRTNDGSSWAIFDKEDQPPQIKGPPVEYGEAETTFAGHLREWYGLLDEKAKDKLEQANQKIVEAGRSK